MIEEIRPKIEKHSFFINTLLIFLTIEVNFYLLYIVVPKIKNVVEKYSISSHEFVLNFTFHVLIKLHLTNYLLNECFC